MSDLTELEKQEKLIQFALTKDSIISDLASSELLEEATKFAKTVLEAIENDIVNLQQVSLVYLVPLLSDHDLERLLHSMASNSEGGLCSSSSDALKILDYLALQVYEQLKVSSQNLSQEEYFVNLKVLTASMTRLEVFNRRSARLELATVLMDSNSSFISIFQDFQKTLSVDSRKIKVID